MIKRVVRFHCGRCHYITEDKYALELIEKTGECPACQDGAPKMWVADKRRGYESSYS